MPGNLHFIGREASLRSALKLLERADGLRIGGAAGVGRTTFLKQLLAAYQEERGSRGWSLFLDGSTVPHEWPEFRRRVVEETQAPPGFAEELDAFLFPEADTPPAPSEGERERMPPLGQPQLLIGIDDFSGGVGNGLEALFARLEEGLERRGFRVVYALVEAYRGGALPNRAMFRGRPLEDHVLEAPSREDVLELCRGLQLPDHEFNRLLERNLTSWSGLHRELVKAEIPRGGEYWDQLAAGLLGGFSEKDQRRILQASLLEDIAPDLFGIFGPMIEAQGVRAWFETHLAEAVTREEARLVLNEPVRTALRRLFDSRHPGGICPGDQPGRAGQCAGQPPAYPSAAHGLFTFSLFPLLHPGIGGTRFF